MTKRVDVAIAFYGKPMQTIIAIKSLMQHSGQYIDKIYLTHEQFQPHNDWSGPHKVIDYFRSDPINFVVYRPYYLLAPNAADVEKTRNDIRYRHSIMYQYALEMTDKPYLFVMHNDMLFHADMIGPMLATFDKHPELAGTGPIGQCWSCPASAAWGGRCSSETMMSYRPDKQEAIELHKSHETPRKALDIDIIEAGRVWPLPECRLNEYATLINVPTYRQQTLPVGDIGCYGGGWKGADLGTIWFYEMIHRGFRFQHFVLEDYARHAPFDDSGSGSLAYSKSDRYWNAERLAIDYINTNYPKRAEFGATVQLNTTFDALRRKSWLAVVHTYGFLKKVIGKA
ncbi:hypothetical protein ACAW74_09080 [Fibrella sp. WM1]|uniref:hypothetical protein n=1 Tax=Fibrella musci TaxID=3242485 RepID=UPI00351FA4C6